MDKTYERALKFMEAFSKKHEGISNVYVFTSVDKDGNVTDEKYSMNLMTRNGFSDIYGSGVEFAAGNDVKLYVGTGVGEVPYTTADTNLELPAFGGLAATNSNTEKAYNYPMYYSKGENEGEGFITLISRFVEAYYDYNIDNFPGDYNLTEYGIKRNNTLWTHSKIYDVQGDPAYITKRSNERLYITVYMCLSFYESIIMNGWSNNRFTLITTNKIMFDRMAWNARIKLYKRGDRLIDITDGGTTKTLDTSQSATYVNSIIAPAIIVRDDNSDTYNSTTHIYGGGYFDGFVFTEDGFSVVEPQFLETAENVEFNNLYSGNATKYSGFADKFGTNPGTGYSSNQYPQMTHFTNAQVKAFDYKSGTWGNVVDVYNVDSKWYDESPGRANMCQPIYYSSNGEIKQGYVFQNIHPTDKILKISGGGITVYATNKYWASAEDSSNADPNKGWVWIRDYNNIPAACQSARYWITNTNVDQLVFTRESDCFHLLEKGTNDHGYVTYTGFPERHYISPICDNYTYGWYKKGPTVFVPSTIRTYTVGGDGDETFTYGKWLIDLPSANNKIITADMSSLASNVFQPSDFTLPFTGNVNTLTQTHHTDSGTGILCLEATNREETVIVDYRQSTITASVHSWKHACAIWGTNKVAYIASGDPNVYIYNCDTGLVEGNPIPFPSGISDIPHLFGHTNFLWMTNGSSFGYVCDLRTPSVRTPVQFVYDGLYGSDLQYVKYACVDDVFVVYKYNEAGNGDIPKAHYIKLSEPTMSYSLADFNAQISGSIGGRIDISLRYVNAYTDQSNNKVGTLAMIISRGYTNSYSSDDGCDCRVIDFGQYLWTGDVRVYAITNNYNLANLCWFGENIIYQTSIKCPAINFMPIKLTGKTDTINAMSHIKNVTGKSWLIGYTNIPSWGDGSSNPKGIPPGVPLANTNANGVITGWSW